MSEKRSQGRPSRGADEVGRKRIVDATRLFMRLRRNGDITRKELASFIGITPALISYYFPERSILIESAVMPVLAGYHERLQALERSSEEPTAKLRDAIELLTEMNLYDGRLVDIFEDRVLSEEPFSGPNLTELMKIDMLSIVEQYIDVGATLYPDRKFVALAVWNICRTAMMLHSNPPSVPSGKTEDAGTATRDQSASLVDCAFALVTSGLGPGSPRIPMRRSRL